jgi:hypothetical protein
MIKRHDIYNINTLEDFDQQKWGFAQNILYIGCLWFEEKKTITKEPTDGQLQEKDYCLVQ